MTTHQWFPLAFVACYKKTPKTSLLHTLPYNRRIQTPLRVSDEVLKQTENVVSVDCLEDEEGLDQMLATPVE